MHAGGRVEITGGIVEEGTDTGSRVLMTIGVTEEGTESLGGVGVARSVMKERLKAKSGVVDAAGEALKCLTSLSGIVPRVAAVRRWADRLRNLPKRSETNQKEDCYGYRLSIFHNIIFCYVCGLRRFARYGGVSLAVH